MKTLNDFFASEQTVHILSVNELVSIKGGDVPPNDPGDPFKRPVRKAWGLSNNTRFSF